MDDIKLILVEHFCTMHEIEIEFIYTLNEYGLVDVHFKEDTGYLSIDDIKNVEKMMNFHFALGVNMEGIDIIIHLLGQINDLKQELNVAKNKLRFYEEIGS